RVVFVDIAILYLQSSIFAGCWSLVAGRWSLVGCRQLDQEISEARPQPLVPEIVADERDGRRPVAPADCWHTQHLTALDAWRTRPRDQRGHAVAALDQRRCERVSAPAGAAASRWKDIAGKQDAHIAILLHLSTHVLDEVRRPEGTRKDEAHHIRRSSFVFRPVQ